MLPYIDCQEWDEMSTLVNKSILISSCSDFKITSLLVVCEPAPAWSLNSNSRCWEVSDEVIEGAECLGKWWAKIRVSCRCNTTSISDWSKTLPEELMVDMTTSVEFNGLRKLCYFLMVTSLKSFISLLHESIQIIDIGLMMLAIVERHEVLGDDWLQSVQCIWKWFEDCLLEGKIPHWCLHHPLRAFEVDSLF